MDIMKRLHAILAPPSSPAIRSRHVPALPETASEVAFARMLRKAGEAQAARDTLSVDQGQPIAAVSTTIGDTLEGAVEIERGGVPAAFVEAAADAVETDGGQPEVPASPAVTLPSITPSRPAVVALPPFGVAWAAISARSTGVATGPGVNGSAAAVQAQNAYKHELYSNPEAHGVRLNQEARLFRDAVARGYVPDSPEGLGTLLEYLGMGRQFEEGGPGRPAAMTAYFNQFFASDIG